MPSRSLFPLTILIYLAILTTALAWNKTGHMLSGVNTPDDYNSRSEPIANKEQCWRVTGWRFFEQEVLTTEDYVLTHSWANAQFHKS